MNDFDEMFRTGLFETLDRGQGSMYDRQEYNQMKAIRQELNDETVAEEATESEETENG